eukprot:456514-Rhodomonas_salina.1
MWEEIKRNSCALDTCAVRTPTRSLNRGGREQKGRREEGGRVRKEEGQGALYRPARYLPVSFTSLQHHVGSSPEIGVHAGMEQVDGSRGGKNREKGKMKEKQERAGRSGRKPG